MDTLEDDTVRRIARRIQAERERRGWSQADLARQSGVSKAAISKIERCDTSPTAGILARLAAAFELTLAGLIVRAESGAGRLSRAADQPVWRDPESGYLRRQIFARPDNPVEIVKVEMPAGKHVTLPASSHANIRQALLVLSGRLVIVEDGERQELHGGDCLGFGPPCDVTFSNESDRPCTYLVALARS
jgi:transcriptional regulator with XRE-family HTH domain